MKIITIYELLGMVKDGKAPNKIKYHSNIYFIYYGNWYRYYDEKGNRHDFLNVLYEDFSNLNDEVEILEEEPRDIEVCGSLFTKSEYDKLAHSEEEKKIPEKLNLDTDELRGKETPRAIDYLIEGKINEVIDYLKSKGDE